MVEREPPAGSMESCGRMRPEPEPAVLVWFSRPDSADLHLSAFSEVELSTGTPVLPAGRRRDHLAAEVDTMVREDFAGRVLHFDSAANRAYAAIAASRRSAGRPILEADCQIGAIARARDAAVATCGGGDFEHRGVAVIDPCAEDCTSS